jgi:hypothetical protein
LTRCQVRHVTTRARGHEVQIEDRTSWSIKRFICTARRYRIVQIRAGHHILTAEDPLLPHLRDVLARSQRPGGAH